MKLRRNNKMGIGQELKWREWVADLIKTHYMHAHMKLLIIKIKNIN